MVSCPWPVQPGDCTRAPGGSKGTHNHLPRFSQSVNYSSHSRRLYHAEQYTLPQIVPAEGTLSPYETCTVEVSFAPTFANAGRGWQHLQGPRARRDYSLFVKFDPVGGGGGQGSSSGGTRRGPTILYCTVILIQYCTCTVCFLYTLPYYLLYCTIGTELGITATVVPVSVSSSPPKQLMFGSCATGLVEHNELKLTNNSNDLSAIFKIRCPAHFKANPCKGVIKRGETELITVIFHPKQFGKFHSRLHVDVYSGEDTPPVHTHTLSVVGTGTASGGLRSDTKKRQFASVNDLSCSIRPHDKRVEVMYVFLYRHLSLVHVHVIHSHERAHRNP